MTAVRQGRVAGVGPEFAPEEIDVNRDDVFNNRHHDAGQAQARAMEVINAMETERDDAVRALEMERAAHRATAARVDRFGGALAEVRLALEELPDVDGVPAALRVARKALADG